MGKSNEDSKVERALSQRQRLEMILTRREEVNPDMMLDDCELAALLNCSVQVLRIGRADGGRVKEQVKNLPPHRVLFGRLIRYRYGDVLQWLDNSNRGEAA